ncbi:FimV/HubP family polar landmark protein [Roseateles asaccharophilus]|uniref:Pilus assembly protein FimV n=1 Tax=Roseateles asaccharophilus TaxID=582607 RepID=A0ABU2ABQ8_9BURK|nr:FimV/HubP family polar landmark protein [Roseateles asaccharophilus]MDR7334631.1 pilus assembly protein FimV [Roseateles asaccharophilus]
MKDHIRDAFEGVRPTGFARNHLALAAALLVASGGVQALGLGKLNVQSALGETMRAEIDVTSLTAEEAATLKVRVAPPETYRAGGVEYNSVLTSAQVQVARQNGRTVLRVSSDRAVQEPFVDVILELTWSSGRLVREYTLLFDPPGMPKPAPIITAPPAIAAAPAPAPATTSEAVPAPAPATTTALPRNGSASAPAPVAAARPPAPVPAPAPVRPPVTAASEYKVRPGDSLSRVASRTQVSGISLDQMLVGLFRNNPDAFIDGNMNLLKSGAVLQVPSSDALAAVPAPEARRIILAQSADFSAYRQRLASAAPTLQSTESERQSKGQVQAAVEDRKPAAAPTPDKLTLSKAGSPAASATEAKLSKDSEKKDAAARVAELTRNVEELKRLSTAARPGAAASAEPAATPVPATLPVAPVVAETASAASAPAVAAASAPASRPQAKASAPLPPPPAAEPPSFIDQLLQSPIVLPLAGVLVFVLGGLGLYRLRARRPARAAETGFHESRLQPDSFFGGTGGQRVDTRDAQNSGQSSMSYSLSQLDAIGDVDPVAEADVYLAYGRDLQAEEILKEALRANPTRLAIRLKLLEVYAKRRDTKGFEQLAVQLYAETRGSGEDWAKAQELGRGIDPDNPLYQPGGAPAHVEDGPELRPEPMNASTLPQTALPSGAAAAAASAAHLATDAMGRSGPDTGPVSGFDLALDLDLDAPEPVSPTAMAATQAMPASVEQAPMTMDFDISSRGTRTAPPAPDLNFDLSGMGDLSPPAAPTTASTDLDFDLGEPTQPGETSPDALTQALDALGDDDGDPLVRQLELADEFRQIGDTEGAREVLQELIQRASGSLRDRAQAMLNDLR